jgi:dolichol kinase
MAHWRQAFAQSIIMASPFAMLSHIVAQAVHISEHIWHIRMAMLELRIMKSAHIWHICAQSIIVFITLESQLPVSRHFACISVQRR